MDNIIKRLIGENTTCDFKEFLERKQFKSWLKSVSAFANGLGGSLFFGVNDDGEVVGLNNIKSDTEFISDKIKIPNRRRKKYSRTSCVIGKYDALLFRE